MDRRKPHFSLHIKLILSYIAVVSIIGIISVSFVFIFANAYMMQQTQARLVENAEAFAQDAAKLNWADQTRITDLKIVFRRNMDANTSLLLADPEFKYIPDSGMNIDYLDTSPEEFVDEISHMPAVIGAHRFRYGDTLYAVHVQQVYNYSTDSVLGYVILFTAPISYRMQNGLLMLYLIALAAASVFAIAISLLFSTELTRNLRKLRKRADQVANRQFDAAVDIRSNDEIADLSQSIDRMANALSRYDAEQKKFLQNASHELRTPLMSIRGYVEGIKDGVFENTDEVADHVLEQVDRLEKLTGDLIYLSKLENADEVLDPAPVSVSDLLKESLFRVAGMSGSGGVKIELGDVCDATVWADGDKVVTAITNLLSNAFRFARQSIELSARTEEDGVVISVADDGPGVAPEDIDHLFDRFYKGRQGKYGLGLSIVNAIVVAHGGTVSAFNRSGEDTGAVFEIHLPFKKKNKKQE